MEGAAEHALSGGNTTPVVRVGDTVRRATGPWTAAVHELLAAYASAGLTETPRALGLDDAGREVLTHLPGELLVEQPPQILWSRDVLGQCARLLRRLHDASAALAGARDRVWRGAPPPPAEVVCHGDFAPYNLLVQEGRVTGVIDCDFAAPGPRIWDLAYLAYRLVPYAEDAEGFDAAVFGTRDERLSLLIDAYGLRYDPAAVRRGAADRLRALAAWTEERAVQTGRADFAAHAAMYRRDAARLDRRSLPADRSAQ